MTHPVIAPSRNLGARFDLPSSIVPFTTPPSAHEEIGPQRAKAEVPSKLRLGHVHLRVRGLDRSLPFYRDVLGLRLTERVGRFAFLAFGDEHHCVALEEIGKWASGRSRRSVGIAHAAFEVSDEAAFLSLRRKLRAASLPFFSRNNGISWTMRLRDPDDLEIEIYVDRRHTASGSALWGGRWRRPTREAEPPRSVAARSVVCEHESRSRTIAPAAIP